MASVAPTLLWFGLDDTRKGTFHLTSALTHTEKVRERDDIRFCSTERPEKYDRVLWWDAIDACWREHVIRETMARADGTCEVIADGALFETQCDFLEACRFENVSYFDVLKWLLPYTRFVAGTYQSGGVNQETAWFTRMSVYDAIRKLEKLYSIEFTVSIEVDEDSQCVHERRLNFCAEQGMWRGLRLVHGKNLPAGYLHVRPEEAITAMYGFGISFGSYDEEGNATGGFTRRLTFGSINGGVNYVADERARERYGRKNTDGSRRHNFGYVIFKDEEKPDRLYTKTHEALQKTNAPRTVYVVENPIDATGWDVGLGDVVLVVGSVEGAPNRQGMRIVERVHIRTEISAEHSAGCDNRRQPFALQRIRETVRTDRLIR